MGLTFQQKFYNIGDEVFIVYDNNIIALVEVPDDKDEAKEVEKKLEKYGYVEKMNFDDVISKGYELLSN